MPECRKADCICLMQVKQHFSSSAFDLQRLQSFMHSFLDASLELKLFHVLFMVANDHPEGLASCKMIIRICRPLANDNPENSRFLCKIWFKSKYLQTMQVRLAQGSGFSSYFFLFSSHLDHLKSFLLIILSFLEKKWCSRNTCLSFQVEGAKKKNNSLVQNFIIRSLFTCCSAIPF